MRLETTRRTDGVLVVAAEETCRYRAIAADPPLDGARFDPLAIPARSAPALKETTP